VEKKINLDVVVPDSPPRVWQTLTDPQELAKWLMPNDFAPALGHRFVFMPADGKKIECQVLALEENELLAYWWDDGESGTPSIVAWTLTPTDGGTRLTLEHRLVETSPVVSLEASMNWSAALGRFPVPTVFMSAEEEQDPNRPLMGLRERALC
jgi:uncharacterized protein YndB with AHSA1/START domain